MAKITKESLALFHHIDDLVDFIALNRFEPENEALTLSEEFQTFPPKIVNIVHIFDFESLINSMGLFDFFAVCSENKFGSIISSFRNTGSDDIADVLEQTAQVVAEHGITREELHEKYIQRFDLQNENPPDDYPELRSALNKLEESLFNILEETDYWERAKS
jgi:hypothetical protein